MVVGAMEQFALSFPSPGQTDPSRLWASQSVADAATEEDRSQFPGDSADAAIVQDDVEDCEENQFFVREEHNEDEVAAQPSPVAR